MEPHVTGAEALSTPNTTAEPVQTIEFLADGNALVERSGGKQDLMMACDVPEFLLAEQRRPQTTLFAPFAFADKVHIDSDRDLIAVVTGFAWKDQQGVSVEVSYIHNGDAKVAWLEPWRLVAVAS